MRTIEEIVFQNLSMAKQLADNGFLETFLKQCGGQELDEEDYYGLTWDAIFCVFPDATGYWNQEIEVDAIVIFDPIIDEFCRLLTRYEMTCDIAPGESGLRHEAVMYVGNAFELGDYIDGYYLYDYDFRIYDTGHGRKRLVVLTGMEFCGFRALPGALADVRRALEYQIQQLRRELGLECGKENNIRKEAA